MTMAIRRLLRYGHQSIKLTFDVCYHLLQHLLGRHSQHLAIARTSHEHM